MSEREGCDGTVYIGHDIGGSVNTWCQLRKGHDGPHALAASDGDHHPDRSQP